MQAHAESWDETEHEAGHREPHLRSVDSQTEELQQDRSRSRESGHDRGSQDTEYWISEAQRVRAEVDELVRLLDPPRTPRAPSAPVREPARPRWEEEPARPRWEEEPARPRRHRAEARPRWEEDDDHEPFTSELEEMRDELEYLREHVASMTDERTRRPRPRPRRRSRPMEEALPMKKLALLMLVADLF